MKVFAYCLREFDELSYMQALCNEKGIQLGYTSEYPSMENAELVRGYDCVSIITNPMIPELLQSYHDYGVKYIATRTIGYDHIDLVYAKKLGMRVFHAEYSPNSVANYTIMLMLMACRNMPFIMETSKLQDFRLQGKMGRELSESTVGIIGTGKIGETVARHLSGFGCKMLAYDPFPKKELESIVCYVSLDELFEKSDLITLHAPGTNENYHLLDDVAFSKMKTGVIIVNAARGSLIDTDALIREIEKGKVSFAALDTIEDESGLYYRDMSHEVLNNQKRAILASYPNVLLSPHMAFYTEQAVRDMVYTVIEAAFMIEQGGKHELEVCDNKN